ncbi:MAG TPA: Bug family tripartite tricarboxylate transporter substrate binding protein, partial [Ramlibacter sp.]|nr:Bug family tripartite tricarboxylate transporter substrate binding protein [Ramlibacter sp.]
DRIIKIWIGFPPGGSADTIARVLAEKMKVSLGQNVVVDNKPGAAGRLILGEIKRMAPDGQNLVLSPSGAMVIAPWLYSTLPYDPIKDFTPISRLVTFDFAITAGPGAPAGDLKSVLAWMKANPGKANYATSGAGTVPHFAGMLLSQAAGVPLTHIAYKGGAPAAQDLIGGQVPLMVDTASETIEHHKAGKVRILAVTGEARNRALPDVPTLKELGINSTADAFFGLYGPPGMSPELVARLDRAVADALRAPDIQERVYGFGLVPNHAPGPQLATTQAEHLKKWETPIKASGFKAE